MMLCGVVDTKNYKKEVTDKSLNDVLHMKCLNRRLTMRFTTTPCQHNSCGTFYRPVIKDARTDPIDIWKKNINSRHYTIRHSTSERIAPLIVFMGAIRYITMCRDHSVYASNQCGHSVYTPRPSNIMFLTCCFAEYLRVQDCYCYWINI